MGRRSTWTSGARRALSALASALAIAGAACYGAGGYQSVAVSHAAEPTAFEGDSAIEPAVVRARPAAVLGPPNEVAPGEDYLSASLREGYRAATAPPRPISTYLVQRGDTLWSIARSHGTSVSTLRSLNQSLRGDVIQPGQELQVVRDIEGLAHTVRSGETLRSIGARYGVVPNTIARANGLDSPDALSVGETLILPGAQARSERAVVASRGGTSTRRTIASAGAYLKGWVWPIIGGIHSSEFGQRWGAFHTGLDIAVPAGTPAGAVAAGQVVFAGWDGGYGYSVIIEHGPAVQTRYAHASKLLVAEGDWVEQGQQVILVGDSGYSTGPHLHFEVLIDGVAENPRDFLP